MKADQTIRYVRLAQQERQPVFVEHFEDWTQLEAHFDPPHRHAYHEVLWFESGRGLHSIDGESIAVEPRTVSLIAQGQVHTFSQTRRVTGYVVCFADDFLEGDTHTTLFNYLGGNPTLPIPPSEQAEGKQLLELILAEYERGGAYGQQRLLRHLIGAFLVRLERIRHLSLGSDPQTQANYRLYRAFIGLLERDFTLHHEVAHYAEHLHRTPGQLSRTLQQAVGKSAKRIILERLLLETKRLLQFSDLSVKEIAFRLGFADPFHLSKVFKSETRLSPLEYRRLRQEQ